MHKDNNKLRTIFLEGIIIFLPLSLTILLIIQSSKIIYHLFSFVFKFLPVAYRDHVFIRSGTVLLAIISLILLILLIGLLIKTWLGKALEKIIDGMIEKIPFFNAIYKALKQFFQIFLDPKSNHFYKVVMVEYPRKGCWSMGFLTNSDGGKYITSSSEEMCTVFVPSTPNPSTGFLIMVPVHDIIVLEMSVETALKFLMSGGILGK